MIDAPKSTLTGAPGWESVPEQIVLAHLAALVPDGLPIVEIGSEYGMSTSILARYSRERTRVHAVDLFPGDLMDIHRANMVACGAVNKIIYHKGRSADVATKWPSRDEIALLFIDGDHHTEGVILDIEHWLPYVKRGGVVVFHDAAPMSNMAPHEQHYEVQAAIATWQRSRDADKAIEWGYAAREFVEAAPVDSMRVFVRVIKSRKPVQD